MFTCYFTRIFGLHLFWWLHPTFTLHAPAFTYPHLLHGSAQHTARIAVWFYPARFRKVAKAVFTHASSLARLKFLLAAPLTLAAGLDVALPHAMVGFKHHLLATASTHAPSFMLPSHALQVGDTCSVAPGWLLLASFLTLPHCLRTTAGSLVTLPLHWTVTSQLRFQRWFGSRKVHTPPLDGYCPGFALWRDTATHRWRTRTLPAPALPAVFSITRATSPAAAPAPFPRNAPLGLPPAGFKAHVLRFPGHGPDASRRTYWRFWLLWFAYAHSSYIAAPQLRLLPPAQHVTFWVCVDFAVLAFFHFACALVAQHG